MKLKKRVSMFLVALTMCGGLFVSPAKAVKNTNYAEEIAALQPGTTPEEIMKSASQIAKQQHVKQDVILKQFYKEITADKAEGDRLAKESGMSIMGGSSGTKKLPTSAKGNIYYTNSYTAYYNHGHVACTPPLTKLLNLSRATASGRSLTMPETWKTTPLCKLSASPHLKKQLPLTGRYQRSAIHTHLTS